MSDIFSTPSSAYASNAASSQFSLGSKFRIGDSKFVLTATGKTFASVVTSPYDGAQSGDQVDRNPAKLIALRSSEQCCRQASAALRFSFQFAA